MQFSRVLLPDPDGPTTTTTSPDFTVRSIPPSTVCAPKRLTKPHISISGVASAPTVCSMGILRTYDYQV